ncbi:MAG: RagB/SusD family nutrient uptake outer membrane protein [Bacteroidaceae bacterium]|nr:RagB/SusD family nutrient uptake outer membrane protein [Bacteroidaceae bacterium]
MKKIFKYLGSTAAVAACALTLTGCVEETLPQSSMATDKIVAESTSATEGIANGMPAYATDVWTTSSHCYFGYPAEMIVRDMLTGDYTHVGETGYSHFISWNRNQYMGQDYMKQQFHWNYYYGFLGSVNGVIRAIDEETAAQGPLAYLGTALAYRAMLYLDLARMYEFLPNEIYADGKNNEGNTVLNLTVPIVDDDITEEEAANNPRATREEMFAFILGDLDKAEKYIVNLTNTSNNSMPDLACVYGLKARLYMWVEQYDKAQEFARKAITAAKVAPLSESKALNVATGYNTSSDFMWCANQNSETYAVQTGIINWTSWVSNQTTFGYTGASTSLYVVMDRSMYERISDTDWRKKQWVAPAGSALEGQTPFMSAVDKQTMPAYASVKFRPNAGDAEDYLTGAASAVPLMRVEEMYFIEAEAAEHVAAGTGIALLTDFMKQYRDPAYAYAGEDAIDEIVFQKRVELWGEGHTFFDIKRLNMSVTRGYEGTNWQDTQSLINTNGRPAWTNYVIVKTEAATNTALVNFNNPDPSDTYAPWAGN